jgi:hypothetical protein
MVIAAHVAARWSVPTQIAGLISEAIPTFPRYRLAKPPGAKRWLGGGAALVLLSGIIAAMAGKSVPIPGSFLAAGWHGITAG